MNKKAIFFDLDGTLWNALDPLMESWNKAMEDKGLSYRFDLEKMTSYMGLTPEETVPLAFPDVPFSKGLSYFNCCLKAEVIYLSAHPGALYPEEEAVLKELSSSYPLYVVSNSGKGYVENYLKACGMGKYFTGHICAGDYGYPKWKNILVLKEKEGLSQVIYVGDTNKDRIESEKAGAMFIHADYGFGRIPGCENEIKSLIELPKAVDKLFS